MNRGFHGRSGLLGIGTCSVVGGMGATSNPIYPALYQLSPSPSTTVAQHSDAAVPIQSHSEAVVAVEYDP